MNYEFFATTAKGVEPILAGELERSGADRISPETGGVRFFGSRKTAYRANLWLRTANRVLLKLDEFPCQSQDELYVGVGHLEWERYLTNTMTLAVDANTRDSNITHSKYAALKTKDAIVDRLRKKTGARPSVNAQNPDIGINIYIFRNRCTISLDMSGGSLHRRGYRRSGVKAPLKETLAAALIGFTGWDGNNPFVDLMCGSGTIVIEAALKAADIAPGLLRRDFGFTRWRDFDARLWRDLVEEAENRAKRKFEAKLVANDISKRAIEVSRANAKAAGVEDFIEFTCKDFTDLDPPEGPGVVIANPPYGERIGDNKMLEATYAALGDVFKHKYTGYTGFIFTGNLELAKKIGLRTSQRIVLFNGPIESRLFRFELY